MSSCMLHSEVFQVDSEHVVISCFTVPFLFHFDWLNPYREVSHFVNFTEESI